ncbi:MAG TPA: TetR family transcriptional regulator [Conexibacter sp.]|jgi:AcrR family transcriptional regulator|nr:TetR family transcriptional regulator [Conexibacter sp.]
MTIPPQRPPRGREAEAARNDRRVLDAAREVFARQGADAPVSAIAAQAGVGIGSLYRRYGSKRELLQQLCLLAMEQSIAAAREGLAADDPWHGLSDYVQACVAFGAGALGALAGAIETTPRMRATSRRSRRLLAELVRRAHAARVLRPDVSPLDVAYLIERLGRRGAEPDDAEQENVRDRVVAIALAGLRAHAGSPPLPGRPPSERRYTGRWSTPAAGGS